MTPIRIRCVRCGDWHEREPGDPYLPWLCHRCVYQGLELLFAGPTAEAAGRRFEFWRARWLKNVEGHPTDKALNEAWAAWRAVEAVAPMTAEPPF